jgi:hypothetical protein
MRRGWLNTTPSITTQHTRGFTPPPPHTLQATIAKHTKHTLRIFLNKTITASTGFKAA